jgi:TolB-like protein
VVSPLGFGQYHAVDLVGWSGDRTAAAFGQLMQAIAHAAAGKPVRREAAPAQAVRRGLSRRWALAIAGAAVPALAAAGWWLARRGAPASSVAVLPFTNLSGDAEQDLVADALAEDVRSALARIPALQVTSRTSSELVRGKAQNAQAIAGQLGVASLLEGALQKAGDTLRIDTQLVGGADGFTRWSQTFDRPADNLLQLESDIAAQVAAALQVKLLAAQAVAPGGTRSMPAYKAYLQARRLYDAEGGEASLRQTVALYEQALALDPAYADAQAGRARSLMAIANQFATGDTRRSLSDQALAAAEAAAAQAADSAEAQAALGFVRMGRLDVKGAGGIWRLRTEGRPLRVGLAGAHASGAARSAQSERPHHIGRCAFPGAQTRRSAGPAASRARAERSGHLRPQPPRGLPASGRRRRGIAGRISRGAGSPLPADGLGDRAATAEEHRRRARDAGPTGRAAGRQWPLSASAGAGAVAPA